MGNAGRHQPHSGATGPPVTRATGGFHRRAPGPQAAAAGRGGAGAAQSASRTSHMAPHGERLTATNNGQTEH
jgi:hypothetical protein